MLTVAILICLLTTVAAFADTKPLTIGNTENAAFVENGGKANVYEYSLTLPKSGTLKIDVTSTVEDSVGYMIYGNGLNSSVYAGEGKSPSAGYLRKGDISLEYKLAAGEYTFELKGEYSKAGDISFTTSFETAEETYTGDNNSVNAVRNSDALTFKKTVYGHMALNDTEDWYKIELPASGKLTFKVHTEVGDDLYFRTDDENGKFISEKTIGKGDETFSLELTKGVYFVKFSNDDKGGSYNFKPTFKSADETYQFENETINLVRSKKAIPFATLINGHFGINDTDDCFKVNAPKAGKYSIKVTSGMDSTTLNIRDKNDKYVAQYFHNKGTSTYTISLKKGNNYLLFERGGNDYGNYSFKVTPATVSIRKLTKATKSARVTWAKGTGDGYQLQYSTDKIFKSSKVTRTAPIVKSIKTTSTTIKNLKSRKTYYVRIRTYVKSASGKKIWSDWSKAKSVKVL